MANVEERMEKLEDKIDQVLTRLGTLEGQYSTTQTVIKWVVFPLIVILGAAFGVKMAFPGI